MRAETETTHLCEHAVFKDQAYAKQSVTTQIACRVTGQHTGRSVCKFMLIGTYQWFWKLKQNNGDVWLYFVSMTNNETRKHCDAARMAITFHVYVHVSAPLILFQVKIFYSNVSILCEIKQFKNTDN